jgi:hypothetical protein
MVNEELNRKLAKWAGWHLEKYEVSSGCFGLILLSPDEELHEGSIGYIPEHAPNFTNSLDACLKWLVPKLYPDKLSGLELVALVNNAICDAIEQKIEIPLALCLAIEKLIESEI